MIVTMMIQISSEGMGPIEPEPKMAG